MIAAPNRYAVRPVRSPRDATFRTCCCATAKSWAGCASISLGGAEQAFTWWHPERSPAARPRPRHAQACGKRRARSGKTEIIIDAHRPRRFYLANGYRQGEWGTPDRHRRPHSRGKAIAV